MSRCHCPGGDGGGHVVDAGIQVIVAVVVFNTGESSSSSKVEGVVDAGSPGGGCHHWHCHMYSYCGTPKSKH